jgi:hypothetical protein
MTVVLSYKCNTDNAKAFSDPVTTKSSDDMPTKKTEQTEILNVRLPAKIISVLDVLVEKGLYTNRSEAVREFLRQYVLERREHK